MAIYMRKKKFLMIMLICLSMILAFHSVNLDGFFVFPETETIPVLELTDNIPFSVALFSGEAEVGFGKGVGEFIAVNNTEISMTLIHPSKNNVKIDPLLFNNSFLEQEGYLEDGTIPVIIQLSECAQEKPITKKTRTAISSARSALSSEVKEYKIDLESICSVSADVELTKLNDLTDSELVSKIYLDQKYTIMLNDSIPIIGADVVWNLTEGNNSINGTGIVIAVLDTGLNFSHPDFQGKNIWAESFNGESVEDNNNHGTHCAGIAAGTGAASDGTFTGVAPGADLMIGKVMSDMGYGYTSWIIAGIEWAMNPTAEPVLTGGEYIVNPSDAPPPDKADVISLSLGGSSTDGNDPLSLAVDAAVDAGIVVVVAAGNSKEPVPMSISAPGVAKKALTVGASAKNGTIAYFSNIGPTSDGRLKPEVVAPGVDICSTKALGFLNNSACGDDDYWPLSGTSMAAPHVAGAAALLLQKHPDWTPEEIKSALVLTAVNLNASAFIQGSGRIDVQRAINTPILTNPAVLNIGFVENNTQSSEITITNILDKPIEINLSVSDLVKTGSVSTPDSSNTSYHVPVAVSKMGMVFVGVEREDGNLSKPTYVVIYHPNNFSRLIVWQNYWDEEYNYTFMLPSGKYTLHVLGDLNDFNLNYVLGDEFELEKGEYKELLYNLGDAKKINLPLHSKDEVPLDIYRFENMVVCYYPTEPTRIRLLNIIWGFGEPIDTTFYVSESTCENRSIQIGIRGSPTRGHFEEWVPGIDLYDNISGKEWAWRWENRDISDEDYLLAWNLKGNVTENIEYTLDIHEVSVLNEVYNFAGYAPFVQKNNPQRFMARSVFWLAPDWFQAMSYMKRPSAPLNRTVYLLGEGWTYNGRLHIKYPNSTTEDNTYQYERPDLTGIKITDTPMYKTYYFGTPPYQMPYFMNEIVSGSRIRIKSNAPLISGFNNSIVVSKGYDSLLNIPIYIHRDETLVFETPNFNNDLFWTNGIINMSNHQPPVFSGYGVYTINMTLPLRYSVYNIIDVYAEINYNESSTDINPPQPTRFWADQAFDYDSAISIEVEFAEELASAEMHYKTDLTDWIPMNISNNGTQINGSINITDGESKNISIKFRVSDAAENNVTYTITPVSVLYREIYFNFTSNQTSAAPGETILFNGTVYDPLDPNFSGIKLKYFVNGEYIGFDRTDFQENLNQIDLRMPSYMMCIGCFEKEFTIPEDFADAQINFTVLFEGSGPYKPLYESIIIDIISNGFSGGSQQQTVQQDNTLNSAIEDETQISETKQQVQSTINEPAEHNSTTTEIGLNETRIVLQPGESRTILVNASVAYDDEGFFYGYILLDAAPVVENGGTGGSTGGSSGGTIPPSTTTQTTSGTSVFYNVVEGETIYLEPTWRMDMAVSAITFSESADELKVSIAKAEPTVLPTGEVYMTFKINSDAKISDATLSFRVPKSWFEQTGASAESIRLAREDGTILTTFGTSIVQEDAEYFYFEAEVDHFSTFSIITLGQEKATLTGFFGILQKIDMYYSRQITFPELVSEISAYFSK